MNNKEEVTINLKNMFGFIISKWRKVIVVTLIIAVLINAYNIVSAYKNNRAIDKKKDPEYVASKLEEYEDKFTDKELDSAEQAHDAYELYSSQYDLKSEYYKNSPKMAFNPEAVPTYTLQYRINCNDAGTNVDNIISLYTTNLFNQHLFDDISIALDGKVNASYVSDLISVNRGNSSDNSQVQINSDSAMINVNIMASDKKDCDTIKDIVIKRIDSYTADMQNSFGRYSLDKVSDKYTESANSSIRDFQNKNQEELVNLKKNITKLSSALTGSVKDYYELKYPSDENEDKEMPYFSAKYIALGVVGGIVFGCIWFSVAYILSKKLKSAEELKDSYGILTFGNTVVPDGLVKKGIDGLAFRLSYGNNELSLEEQIERIAAEIKMYSKTNELKNIMITGTFLSDEIKGIKDKLSAIINSDNISISTTDSIVSDTNAFNSLESVDGVVIIEKVMNSSAVEVSKEIELCRRSDVPVIGAVIVAE